MEKRLNKMMKMS